MNRIFILFAIFIFQCFPSQKTLSEYPDGQSPYKGGSEQMFSEMQGYFSKIGQNPCDEKQRYWVVLKIDDTGKPFLVKRKSDEANIEKNKCAFDLAVKALGSLKNWQPAERKGKKISAYFDFPFIPADFFENYKSGYDIIKTVEPPVFIGGEDVFMREIRKNITGYLDWYSYIPEGKFIIFFEIGTDGRMSNIDIEPKLPNSKTFYEDMKFAIRKVKGKWSPAKIGGIPIKSKYRLSLDFHIPD
ncbi:MAG: hypothetical protein Q4G16_10910 [Cruoricaptor ignavus]|nr:hypothetical protein [Cruoricaptor ignavus]